MAKDVQQGELAFPERRTWGGRRGKAGRKKRKVGVAHGRRERVSRHDPRLVTTKLARGLPRLRVPVTRLLIEDVLRKAQRDSFRIVAYTIQSDHLHLMVEADDGAAYSSGMRGLMRRLVHGLNRLWKRSGSLFPERFHDRVLRSLRQVRYALRYVLNNHLKHGHGPAVRDGVVVGDPYSSARWFDGWREGAKVRGRGDGGPAVVVRGGWKLGVGWRRYELISVREVPGA